MATPILTILLSEAAARAVCWTLVHSLWQGTLAALIAGGIIIATRKQSAALRYNLLTVLTAAFVLLATSTFIYELRLNQPQPTIITGTQVQVQIANAQLQQQTHTPVSTGAHPSIDILQFAGDYLNTHAALVTLIWLACFLAQLLRLSGGLYKIHRLRRDSTTHPSEYWTTELITLAKQLGINRSVSLLQSRWVKTPAAIGWLKPAILVPLGLLAQLPAHQVETILLHELAHIRRNDYLANLLLHCTEAIFFFNPGIRWIASLIRREREACCDDVVLAGTTDRNSYFEALVAFTQLSIDNRVGAPRGAYMLQFSGTRKTDLLWRIRRMLEKENKKLHLLEKTILSFALFALVSFSLIKPQPPTHPKALVAAPANAASTATLVPVANVKSPAIASPLLTPVPASAPPPPPPPAPVPATTTDTPSKEFAFNTLSHNSNSTGGLQRYKANAQANDGHTYSISRRNDEILEFEVDGQRIAKSAYAHYGAALALFETDARICRTPVVIPSEPPTNPAETTVTAGEPIPPVAPEPESPVAPITATGAITPVAPITATGRIAAATPMFPVKPVTPVKPMALGHSLFAPVSTGEPDNTPRTERRPTPEYPVVYWKTQDIDILHIAVDLVKIHLITDVGKYEFYLSQSTFTVNGVNVPDDIAGQFRKKYVLGPDYTFEYWQSWTPKGSSAHCNVHTPNRTANLTNHS
jgi:bla regulator protein BlaR1